MECLRLKKSNFINKRLRLCFFLTTRHPVLPKTKASKPKTITIFDAFNMMPNHVYNNIVVSLRIYQTIFSATLSFLLDCLQLKLNIHVIYRGR